VNIGLLAFEKEFLERNGDVLGEADADEAAGRDRITVADQAHRLPGGDDSSRCPRHAATRPSDDLREAWGISWNSVRIGSVTQMRPRDYRRSRRTAERRKTPPLLTASCAAQNFSGTYL
jgi:hypothetical protein